MPAARSVGIVGGGIGGLTLAHALSGCGIEARVFEQREDLSEVGAGITLWRNALSVLECVGLGEALAADGAESTGGVVGTADGRVLVRMGDHDLPPSIRRPALLAFHRVDLQRILFDTLPEGVVSFAHRLVDIEWTGSAALARFEGGREHRFDVLVGADGIRSRTRELVLGDGAPRYAGYSCWRGVVSVPGDWGGAPGEFWGRGDRIGVVPIGKGRLYWFAVVNAPERKPVAQPKHYLLDRFGGYAFDVPRIIESTPESAILHNDIVDRPPIPRWSRGCITLMGDAAHATTPNMGQGAAMAIESAYVLARALAESADVEVALARYERSRKARSRWVTETSWRLGKVAQLENGLLCRLRNGLFSRLPARARARQLERMAAYDVTVEPLA